MTTTFHRPETLVVIPCLNEAAHIGPLLDRLRGEADRVPLQIVVADGGSTDATRAIVEAVAAEDPRVVLMDNPGRLQSAGVNAAVERFAAGMTHIIRVDAHSDYPADYCWQLLAEAAASGADSVVVSMRTEGSGPFQRGVAAAQNSVLATGGSAHRKPTSGRFVDHGHHALMRTEAFRAVNGYDPTFSHNEDAEFDHRLARHGGRIWLTDRVDVAYTPRDTVSRLFRQYLNYGRGRARTILKHRMKPKLRQVAPALVVPAVAAAVAGLGAARFAGAWAALVAAPVVLWALVCLCGGLALAFRARDAAVAWAGPAAMVMHFAWSAGFIEQVLLRGRDR